MSVLLWSWLVRVALGYSYELRAHVTFIKDTNDYNSVLIVGQFADYGKERTERRRGRLVVPDETYGCPGTNATLPPVTTTSLFIVVLPLSECNDYTQAQTAELDGASGVVFYYTPDSAKDGTSQVRDTSLVIPVAVVDVGDVADFVASLSGQSSAPYNGVAIEGVQYAVFRQSRTFYFIVTAFCILILLSCLWFFTSYFRRCRYTVRNRRRQVLVYYQLVYYVHVPHLPCCSASVALP